ncbi:MULTISPECIES: CvpA family protein [Paracoccaceae]|jgi:membrane protein required for colicin V production|uniref:CvpA family protein n=1 Tax=Rhodobacterales TaxID=204455 RepID=UPI001D0A0369|nr:CvpA family protein [Boseongicola sp. H5]
MDGFTIIDGVVAGVIVISAILAYSRGFVREVMAIVGWIIAAVVAFIFAPIAFPLVDEIPYLGSFIGGSNELGIIVAFAGVFAIALVIVSIFTPLFASAVQRSVLGGLDAGLGFLFGVARGILLIVVALIVYDRVSGDQAVSMVDDSRTAQIFGQLQDRIEAQIPSNAPAWILDRYEELINATEPATDEPAAPETTGN